MMHCSDDDLVLHYYGDPDAPADAGTHLAVCNDCRERFDELTASLGTMTFAEPPDPGDQYGGELWQRLEPRLEREPGWRVVQFQPRRAMLRTTVRRSLFATAAAAVLLIAGFAIGRMTPRPQPTDAELIGAEAARSIGAEAARRVLLMSVTEHLERSDRVLTDVLNASLEGDIATEREWAADLIADNRFFRQDAIDSDERSVAAVLDELERALLDIVHSPADATPADLEEIHRRVDSAALLFKVRVLSGELRQRQREPRPAQTSTAPPSRIS